MKVAALFVQKGGAYYGIEDVDPWPEERDARLYAGPWPVVAHPPCARWCRLAKLVQALGGKRVGDDDGCFAAALEAVRKWGGCLEHPAWSLAWPHFGLLEPPSRGWARMMTGEWVCEVSQTPYGHKAEKLTWLLYVGDSAPPLLDWSRPEPTAWVTECRRRGDGSPMHNTRKGMRRRERIATPPAFRDILLDIARNARTQPVAALSGR